MSTQEILSQVESLSLSERMALLEAIVQSVKAEIENPEYNRKVAEEWEEIYRRRREFIIPTFDLGEDVVVRRS